MPPRFLENMVILCFERRFSQQNSVIRLKSNILAPTNFWAGYATDQTKTRFCHVLLFPCLVGEEFRGCQMAK